MQSKSPLKQAYQDIHRIASGEQYKQNLRKACLDRVKQQRLEILANGRTARSLQNSLHSIMSQQMANGSCARARKADV